MSAQPDTLLVTGGAGYIGAHVIRAVQSAGVMAVVVDDLTSGHAGFVLEGVPFSRGNVLDRAYRSLCSASYRWLE